MLGVYRNAKHQFFLHSNKKMPLCTVNKWGCGTTTEKVPDTEAAKAMKEKLAATLAERARQDALWQAPSPSAPAAAKKTG